MRQYAMHIAGYRIRFEAEGRDCDLVPARRFMNFISETSDYDLLIRVYHGSPELSSKARCVFNAPYVEEINGIRIKKKDEFWSVWKDGDELFIKATSPFNSQRSLLKFSLSSATWELWVDACNKVDPLEYPVDSLLLYYLATLNGGIMIHASGIVFEGKGFIFSGISGKGKSTIAGLWNNYGARVIHDDRLILKIKDNCVRMFNTPVYDNDEPREAAAGTIFIIDHGKKNIMSELRGAEAESSLLTNCIQHNWEPSIINSLLQSVTSLCKHIPVKRLSFLPDESMIEYILKNS